jgi:addiction module HigA family antidote
MGKAKKLESIGPGEMLMEEFLKPMGISRYRLAKEIGVPAQRIGEIVAGRCAISADTDLRLCRFLGLSDGWWLRGQVRYDMECARDCDEEFQAANRRAVARQRRTPVATVVRYDRRIDRIVIDLSSGLEVAFRPNDAQGLKHAKPPELGTIEISPSGLRINFERRPLPPNATGRICWIRALDGGEGEIRRQGFDEGERREVSMRANVRLDLRLSEKDRERIDRAGPLIDASGNVMGVVESKLNAVKVAQITGDIPQNVNFAIKANTLQALSRSQRG